MPLNPPSEQKPATTKSNGIITIPQGYDDEKVYLDINVTHKGLISESHRIEIDGKFHAFYDKPIHNPVPISTADAVRGKTIRIISSIGKLTYPDLTVDKNNNLTKDFPLSIEYVFSCADPSNVIERSSVKQGLFPKKIMETFLTDYLTQ